MKWFNVIKRHFTLRDDFTSDVTDFSLPDARHSALPPDIKWSDKIREDSRSKKESKPIIIQDEGVCPPGELWCEQHEECETQKDWETHNKLLTAEEAENQKQFEASGKLSDK